MNKKFALAIPAVLALIGLAAFFYGTGGLSGASYIDPADPALVARGKTIYARQCASCHGARLEGQPDWRRRLPTGRLPAPPHDESGHTWHHPDKVLVDIVKNGLVPGRTAPDAYQSDMPAYGGALSDADIAAVLAYIKSNWPPEALAAQKDITLQRED